ncbi:hypothetical protein, partial [Hymenobacter agri]
MYSFLLRKASAALLTLAALGWAAGPAAAQVAAPVFGSAAPVGLTQGGESYASALANDALGNAYVAGHFAGTLAIGGQTFTSRANHYDVFVAKYDALGNLLWVTTGGGDSDDMVASLVLDAGGNVYIAGSHATRAYFGSVLLPDAVGQPGSTWYSDAFVARLDGAGTWQWAVQAGGTNNDYASALAIDGTGTLVLAGGFYSPQATFGATALTKAGTGSYTADIFVSRLSTTGTWLSATAVGGPGTEQLGKLALDAGGNAYLCGSFQSAALTFGSLALTNADPAATTSDLFVAKLTPA